YNSAKRNRPITRFSQTARQRTRNETTSAPLELKEVKETLAAIAKQAIDQPKIDSAPQVAQPPEMNTPKEPTKNTTREQQPPPELIIPTKDSPKLAENVAKTNQPLPNYLKKKKPCNFSKRALKNQ
ncbi:hypothetical protein, partial [Micromonospora zhanjiangensis]